MKEVNSSVRRAHTVNGVVESHLFEAALVYNIFYLKVHTIVLRDGELLSPAQSSKCTLHLLRVVTCLLYRLCVATNSPLRLRVVAGDTFPVRP